MKTQKRLHNQEALEILLLFDLYLSFDEFFYSV
jgi:hypothetical protein